MKQDRIRNRQNSRVCKSSERSRACGWLTMMIFALLFCATLPASAQVIINEIMYNPYGDDYHTEYIELLNLGDEPVFLYNWRISVGSESDYLIPQPGSNQLTIDAGGYAVVIDPGYWPYSLDLYEGQIPPDALVITIDDPAFGSNGLPNDYSRLVELVNEDGDVVSQREYRPDAANGISEERIRPTGDESDENWAFSTAFGTPGFVNSVTPPPNDLAVHADSIYATYDTDLDRNTVVFDLTVSNVGRDTAEPRQLDLRLTSDYTGFDSTLYTYDIHELPFEAEVNIYRECSVDAPFGFYTATAILTPQDDVAENDTTRTEILLRATPDPGEDWLIFSEVMLDPPNRPYWREWIELRVTHDVPFNPSGWGVMDAAGTIARIPDTQMLFQPDSLYVLAPDYDVLYWEPVRIDQVIVPEFWPQLNNYGEVLTILTPDSTPYLSVGVTNGHPGVSMHWYDGEHVETAWQPTHYEPYGTPGRENWTVYPDQDFALKSIECELDPGDVANLQDDVLTVTVDVSMEGWFMEEEVPWEVHAIRGGTVIDLGTRYSFAPEPTGTRQWTASFDPTLLPFPGEWIITAQLGQSDADYYNNDAATTLNVTSIDGSADGTHASVVEVSPNPFSPDGDGYEDITEFRFDYPADSIFITIRLFDSSGRPLGIIARDVHLFGTGTFGWDGRSGLNSGSPLPLGLYAYVIDIRSTDGEQQWRVKGALASAGGR